MASSKGGRKAQRERNETIPLKDNLDRHYKPIFDQFAEQGGIPLSHLKATLARAGGSDLPPGVIEMALQKADMDRNKVLDYKEFVELMESQEMQDLDHSQLTGFRQMLRIAVSSVVPARKNSMGEDYVEQYVDHYNCCPPPFFMILISLVELAMFIYYVQDMKHKGCDTTFKSGAPLYSPLTYNPRRRYEAWRFLSYMFIHDGIWHILSNLIFQLIIGLPLELIHKFWRVGIVYLLGVIAGSLGSSIVDSYTFLVGASGGCYALIGAHFATIIMNWKNMTHDWMTGPIKFILSAPVQLAFWSIYVAVDVGTAIWSRHFNPNKISYAAHFAGMIAGVLIGIPVLKNLEVLRWEKVLWWVCLVTYLLLVLFAVLWNGFSTTFPITDWRPCCNATVGMC